MALKRMDNVGIVVDDLEATIAFFRELGLDLEGRATIEGEWAGRVTGLGDQRVEIAMMRTPDAKGGSSSPGFSRYKRVKGLASALRQRRAQSMRISRMRRHRLAILKTSVLSLAIA